ncbi:MAG: hypothetical protein O7C60_01295, partial [Rickettsia endosymbiont of Ixodes persulcatus]|nr:hypothetical protein [Rickettsia endosymbiont of Ixodes persulcatus]
TNNFLPMKIEMIIHLDILKRGIHDLKHEIGHQRVGRDYWVYKVKQKAGHTIDKFKERLVTKGF